MAGAIPPEGNGVWEGRQELNQARLAILHLRSTVASLEERMRTLETERRAAERDAARAREMLRSAEASLADMRAKRDHAEAELGRVLELQRRESTELARAGWRIEHERRTKAEAEAAEQRALRSAVAGALADELARLEALTREWQEVAAGDEHAGEARGTPKARDTGEVGPDRPRLRSFLRRAASSERSLRGAAPSDPSPRGVAQAERPLAAPSDLPARGAAHSERSRGDGNGGLLLARALELATGEVDAPRAVSELVALARRESASLDDAISARRGNVGWLRDIRGVAHWSGCHNRFESIGLDR